MTLFVNNEKIEKSAIEEEANRLRPQYQQVFKEQSPVEQEKQLHEWAKENVIERILLLQLARNDSRPLAGELLISKLEEWKKENNTEDLSEQDLEELKKEMDLQLRVEKIIEEQCKNLPQPTVDQARKYYTENRDKFYTPEQVRAAHIVKHLDESTTEEQALKEIKTIQKEIRETKNFEMVADKNSDCPGNGGDLGYFTRGQMVQEFEDVVFSMKVNQISHIFKTPFGYHIAKVHDHKPSSLIGFKKVKDQIIDQLKEDTRNKKVEGLLDELTEKAEIVEKDES